MCEKHYCNITKYVLICNLHNYNVHLEITYPLTAIQASHLINKSLSHTLAMKNPQHHSFCALVHCAGVTPHFAPPAHINSPLLVSVSHLTRGCQTPQWNRWLMVHTPVSSLCHTHIRLSCHRMPCHTAIWPDLWMH